MPVSLAAQDNEDARVVRGKEPDVEDVVMTPVDDLNLDRDQIPEVLQTAAKNPYDSMSEASCKELNYAIEDLTAVLGADFDLSNEETDPFSEGSIAKRVVGSFVPFRGILREVTGAAPEERRLEAAILAGMSRRAYLKGLGEAKGCPYPARPAFVQIKIDGDDVQELSRDQD
ncbi:hypothetical protein [Altererythrobacter sp. GH1-8]|uniref:hypothetical protein n=1 Tax=Altererythrobacter sp. GH1-8 TaxID=3349333 RepID=UPI00374D0320